MRCLILLVASLLLVGCGSSASNENAANRQSRQLNAELRAEAREMARDIQVAGKIFRVTVLREGGYTTAATDLSFSDFVVKRSPDPYALVELVSPKNAAYTASDVETAARSASGCRATLDLGVLAFLGGGSAARADLSGLQAKVSKFMGWRVDLTC